MEHACSRMDSETRRFNGIEVLVAKIVAGVAAGVLL
jgi:hypothetical protein